MNNKRRLTINKGIGFTDKAQELLYELTENLMIDSESDLELHDVIYNPAWRSGLTAITELLTEARPFINQAAEEEQECYDNLPEGIQDSERGYRFEERADALKSAVELIDDLVHCISEALADNFVSSEYQSINTISTEMEEVFYEAQGTLYE